MALFGKSKDRTDGAQRRLRTAAVGAGHFGRFHAEKLARLPASELVAVCDTSAERAAEVAARHGVEAVTDYRELLGRVDAVSIAVPTRHHHAVARVFLEAGVHVLVEKPIAETLAEADDLVATAEARGVTLQVGHLERFSAVGQVITKLISRPLFVEGYRIAPFNPRGTDVSVVFDLMIHDIDLLLAFVGAPVESVNAIGAPILTSAEDIANTRFRFENGCVANLTASRVSMKTERKMRIFQHDRYLSIDFAAHRVTVARKGEGEMMPGIPNFDVERKKYKDVDALEREIEAFLEAALSGTRPLVTGEDGREALRAAIKVTESLQEHIDFVRDHEPEVLANL